jgi:hypothetical protein
MINVEEKSMDMRLIVAIIYLVIVWGFIAIFIKPHRIKELLPIAVIGFLVLFLTEKYLITLGLYEFTKPILPIFGIPLLHLLWGAGSAIVVMNFMPQNIIKQLFILLIFTFITMIFEYFPEHLGLTKHLGKYSEIHDAIQDYLSLIVVIWLSEGFFKKSIYKEPVKNK